MIKFEYVIVFTDSLIERSMQLQNMSSVSVKSLYENLDYFIHNNEIRYAEFTSLMEELLNKNVLVISDLFIILNNTSENNKVSEFMDMFMDTVVNMHNVQNGVDVLKLLLKGTKKLNGSSKVVVTRNLYGSKNIRNLIKHYPVYDNGYASMSESIFCSVKTDCKLMVNIDICGSAFTSLVEDPDIRMDLLRHIEAVLTGNRDYTYDDPSRMATTQMSTIDYCIMCLNILVEVIKRYEDVRYIDEDIRTIIYDTFIHGVHVVYLTTYRINHNIKASIMECENLLQNLKKQNPLPLENIRELQEKIDKGLSMLSTLSMHCTTIDYEFIDKMILDTIDYAIAKNMFDYIKQFIESFSTIPVNVMKMTKNSLAAIILKILNSKTSVHIKFDSMRFIMSRNLQNELFSLDNAIKIVSEYIRHDAREIKNIGNMHMIDLMIELSNTPVAKDLDTIETYLYHIPDFIELFKMLITRYHAFSDASKPYVIEDIGRIIDASVLLIKDVPVLENLSLSYIDDLLLMIDTIVNIKKSVQTVYPDLESQLQAFDKISDMYLNRTKPYLLNMLKNISDNHQLSVNKRSFDILTDRLKINYIECVNHDDHYYHNDHNERDNVEQNTFSLYVIDDDSVPTDLCDVVNYVVAKNPYYISTNQNSDKQIHLQLIDRKTYYDICQRELNPFTRDHITKDAFDKFNNTEEIMIKRLEVSNRILGEIKKHTMVRIKY